MWHPNASTVRLRLRLCSRCEFLLYNRLIEAPLHVLFGFGLAIPCIGMYIIAISSKQCMNFFQVAQTTKSGSPVMDLGTQQSAYFNTTLEESVSIHYTALDKARYDILEPSGAIIYVVTPSLCPVLGRVTKWPSDELSKGVGLGLYRFIEFLLNFPDHVSTSTCQYHSFDVVEHIHPSTATLQPCHDLLSDGPLLGQVETLMS